MGQNVGHNDLSFSCNGFSTYYKTKVTLEKKIMGQNNTSILEKSRFNT